MKEEAAHGRDPLSAAAVARQAQDARRAAAAEPSPEPPVAVRDPLPFCVWTTVALLAWIFSPPLVVAVFGLFGLRAYRRAWRAGLRRSSCALGDPRWVMLYLAVLSLAGLVATGWWLWGFFA